MEQSIIPSILKENERGLTREWISGLQKAGALRSGQVSEEKLAEDCRGLIVALARGAATGEFDNITTPVWDPARSVLEEITRARTALGMTPSEIATFVFSLKEPLFQFLRKELEDDREQLADEMWRATQLIDKFGLYTTQLSQKAREEVIARQQEELLELSTPVVKLWDGVLALPLIGTLDSSRTQIVMESLLEQILTTGAEIAIIDITGVPTVDTLVAQHLIRTVAAARLMGADCIISGIRPQIAQTIVHLGLELDVVSKATMAAAFELALRRLGKAVVDRPVGRGEA